MYKKLYDKYINNKLKLTKKEMIAIFALIIVLSGVFGFFYEFVFYYLNSGMKTWYYRGANFLPFINIYAYGAILIGIITRKVRKSPIKVFLLSGLVCGLLELVSGWAIYEFLGERYWDYNTELWTIGNIGGFVCLRSVTFFAFSGLLLVYIMEPLVIYLSQKMNKKVFFYISIILLTLFLFDEVYNLIIARIIDTPRAHSVYEKLGYKYM